MSFQPEVNKIDLKATDGLAGVKNSLAYRTHEIETHFHSYERWCEKAGTPSGEDTICVPVGDADGAGVFQPDAGDDDWGSWLQIVGATDTPVVTGGVYYELHKLLVTATELNEIYFLQIAFGATGAAGLAADDYITTAFIPASNAIDSAPVTVQSKRIAVTTKAWIRLMCPGQDTATLNFLFGLHEYPG